ncbi:MAG: tetratricopeptide repeat protein [Spirochaetaceae bacterium]|nr:tetratricopeptide repeat protein [Spirochaetaceae bacterium]
MKESPDTLNSQAIELASRGEYTEAIACFKRALTMANKNYLLWYNLGITYRDAGKLHQAKNAIIAAYNLAPNNEDILETLSHICYLLEDYDEASYYIDTGIEINYLNPRFWNNKGVIFFAKGDYNEACESFENAVTIDPNYYDALYNLRDTYEQLGNKNGAKECNFRLKTISHGESYA